MGTKLKGERIRQLFSDPLSIKAKQHVGIEVERIGINSDLTPFSYSDTATKKGAETLLNTLTQKQGWAPINNSKGQPLGHDTPTGKVSLEPGSQLEFSSVVFPDLVNLAKAVNRVEDTVSLITKPWGVSWVNVGVNPFHSVGDTELIPSPRYGIMTDFLGRRARLGTSMMRLTSSVQINLDYSSEAEAIEMFRVSLAAAPLAYALFGNSPYSQKKQTGLLSYRGAIWKETDPDRTGLVPQAFAEGFGFAEYADLVWHRPLMFVQDDNGDYMPARGLSLDAISEGRLPGAHVSPENEMNAVREMFFESRLKPGYVEVRSVDGQFRDQRYGATAFWMGLLYSSDARRLVLNKLANLAAEEREQLLLESLEKGLEARVRDTTLSAIAKELLPACTALLKQRGLNEECFLGPVLETVADGMNPAQRLLAGPAPTSPDFLGYITCDKSVPCAE